MYNKRVRLQCSSCEQFFLAAPAKRQGEARKNILCRACRSPQGKSSQMILIEVKEHSHLLHLYQAAYNHDQRQEPNSQEQYVHALAECNRFFSGGASCL